MISWLWQQPFAGRAGYCAFVSAAEKRMKLVWVPRGWKSDLAVVTRGRAGKQTMMMIKINKDIRSNIYALPFFATTANLEINH